MRVFKSTVTGTGFIQLFVVSLMTVGLVATEHEPLSTRLIDEAILARLKREKISAAPKSSDSEFIRRVTLDLTGRLPEVETAREFLASNDPRKREKYVDSLFPDIPTMGIGRRLKDRPFLDRWAYFFSDLFRNNEQLREGAPVFHGHLYKALELNLPYDAMVRDLITASGISSWTTGATNFVARHRVMEGDGYSKMNHEDTCDELAIGTTKLFLGVNLECVSCHDGKGHLEKINLWLARQKRTSVWRQAAFFGKTYVAPAYGRFPEFMVNDSEAGYDTSGKSVVRMPRYKADVYPEFILGGEKPKDAERERESYARILISHPQFARAAVNMFWAELMGRGIVDPPFGFDLDRQDPSNPPPAPWTIQPSHPELLDRLAATFRDQRYDIRYLMRTIVLSGAYQYSSEWSGSTHEPDAALFARRKLRRLPAEQLWDAVSQVSGIPNKFEGLYHKQKYSRLLQAPFYQDYQSSQVKLFRLLEILGQTDREDMSQDRSSLLQAASLLNHDLVQQAVTASKGSRLEGMLSAEETPERIVETLYLAALSRYPTPRESGIAGSMIRQRSPEGAEDVLWSLLNSVEFLFY